MADQIEVQVEEPLRRDERLNQLVDVASAKLREVGHPMRSPVRATWSLRGDVPHQPLLNLTLRGYDGEIQKLFTPEELEDQWRLPFQLHIALDGLLKQYIDRSIDLMLSE